MESKSKKSSTELQMPCLCSSFGTVTNYFQRSYRRALVSLFHLAVLRIRIRRILMFLSYPDPKPDPLVRDTDPDPSIIKQKLIPTVLSLL